MLFLSFAAHHSEKTDFNRFLTIWLGGKSI